MSRVGTRARVRRFLRRDDLSVYAI